MSKRVLVVDDSMMVRRQVSTALIRAGFQVELAADGMEAFERLTGDTALIVCDVNMPRMSGIDLLTQLRVHPDYAAIPVVMLTTEGQGELVKRAKSLGAKGWIYKPFNAELVIATVRKLLSDAA